MSSLYELRQNVKRWLLLDCSIIKIQAFVRWNPNHDKTLQSLGKRAVDQNKAPETADELL